MSYRKSINDFIIRLEELNQYGGTGNELSIKSAFKALVNIYAKSKSLILVDELNYPTNFGTIVQPDGTLRDAIRLNWGYWESKDLKDNIDQEIENKIRIGYPTSNIIFENSEIFVLYQNEKEVYRCTISDVEDLDILLKKYISFQPREIKEFYRAIERFKEELPKILLVLRENISKKRQESSKLKSIMSDFLEVCREAINPNMIIEDVQEMMIQHLLTQDIFIFIFEEDQFHRSNNIARELQKLIEAFFPRIERKNLLGNIENYYKVIKRAASNVINHKEKQQFLKVLYENFYQAYNPKAADTLGIFYTSNEIVDFMVDGTNYLLNRHFNKLLSDKNIDILDPATGTGTFISEIIEKIPNSMLKHKYQEEIHCNEVSILPYYIANLNIENTYYNKMKKTEYLEFKNICFVDTLDNLGFYFKDKQTRLFDLGDENLERIKEQNKKKICVIIGNPPYNANQLNFNEANKNRQYPDIDKRIKDSYIKESSAQKTRLYDMYVRFLRWSTDRISNNGIISFVSNNSFIESKSYDGFRKMMAKEFNEMWVINLKGNARTKGERRKKEGGNIFEDKIKVGIAIYFLIKNKKLEDNFNLYLYEIKDYLNFEEKKVFLIENSLESLQNQFKDIRSTENGTWSDQPESDFFKFLKIAKKNKNDKENAIFNLKFPGINTSRDEWVYDFDTDNLKNKIKYFIKKYNENLDIIKNRSIKNNKIEEYLDFSIKWSSGLKNNLRRLVKLKFHENKIADVNYRPFIFKNFYYDKPLSDRLTNHYFKTFGMI